MPRIWFSADQHFGHQNIIRYCSRPFASVEEMDAELIERWNSLVAADDLVWCLGDFSMSFRRTIAISPLLKGRKKLIAGNHDRCLGVRPARVARRLALLATGWESVDERAQIEIGGHKVLLAHVPFVGNEVYPTEELDAPRDSGDWLLHGHIHEKWLQRGRMINVGVDVWNFAPVSIETISDLILKGPT
jgi:calcineurin-like phosphoesterase family protein